MDVPYVCHPSPSHRMTPAGDHLQICGPRWSAWLAWHRRAIWGAGKRWPWSSERGEWNMDDRCDVAIPHDSNYMSMIVHVHIYIYIYYYYIKHIYIYIHTYIYTYIYVHIYIYNYIHTHIYIYIYRCTFTFVTLGFGSLVLFWLP